MVGLSLMQSQASALDTAGWGRALSSRLKTRRIGRPLLAFDRITSTSDMVKQFALKGASDGLVVVARSQSRGRGRRGRTWVSPAGQGVYLSVLLRPRLASSDAGWLAILGGVAVARVLGQLGVKCVALKWPNDVLVNGRKIAGVLVEPRLGRGHVEFAVVGIGVNVAQRPRDWGAPLRQEATSCAIEGVRANVNEVIVKLLKEVDKWYLKLAAGDHNALMKCWVTHGGASRMPVVD